mmetsp:Transcript_61582/g.194885  ORF Transcript_61582/g.194885 Transcript_61582/m.194885 type:complete len:131 (-) Transcript_61582:718-1110(-)
MASRLTGLAKVVIQFCVTNPETRAPREFWRQCQTVKFRAINPDCEVRLAVREDGAPSMVKVDYTNGKSDIFKTEEMDYLGIIDRIANGSKQSELQELFKAAGIPANTKIHADKPYAPVRKVPVEPIQYPK